MYEDYEKLIKESKARLRTLAKEHRNKLVGTRMRLLYLLKSGEAKTVSQAAQKIHYSRSQCHRWLKSYREEGLEALLKPEKKPPGLTERMTPAAWKSLTEALAKGEIASYKQARAFLAKEGIIYKDDSSILKLFQRHQIKSKPGRPQHEKADVEAREAFKKTSLKH